MANDELIIELLIILHAIITMTYINSKSQSPYFGKKQVNHKVNILSGNCLRTFTSIYYNIVLEGSVLTLVFV